MPLFGPGKEGDLAEPDDQGGPDRPALYGFARLNKTHNLGGELWLTKKRD